VYLEVPYAFIRLTFTYIKKNVSTLYDDLQDPSTRHGFRVTGDVCYEEAIKVVSAITPVPGGMGPVTISMLLSNTLDSAKRAFGFTST
jgi:5,10-methylene-tetrahydrofolate dehydrogenase/methenyl tetrahydrofolate cyclohydrolase